MNASRRSWFRLLRPDGFIAILPESPWFLVESDSTSYFNHGVKCFERHTRVRYGRNDKEAPNSFWFHLYPLQVSDLIEIMPRYLASLCFLGTAAIYNPPKIIKGGDRHAIFLNLGKEVIPA